MIIAAVLDTVTCSGTGITTNTGTVCASTSSGASTVFSSPTSSLTSSVGLGAVAGVIVEVAALLALMAIVGFFVIIVVANRAEPDPTGRRPQSVYFFAVSFVTLVTAIMGSIVIVVSMVQLIGHHGGSVVDAPSRADVLGALIMLVSFFLLRTHLRQGVALVGPDASSPSRRVGQSYVSAVSFLSMVVLLFASVAVAYLVFALAGPGVFGSFGGRTPAWRYLIDALYVDAAAAVVLVTHRNLVSPGLHLFSPGWRRGGTPTQVSAPPPA